MAIALYLAMTAAETAAYPPPEHMAYMACHFASYDPGLSNIPAHLPAGALLILNDRIPVWKHDPDLISRQLTDTVVKLNCCGVLLDFQRPGCPKTADVVSAVLQTLSCPVGVSEQYAQDLNCPVFLSAPPPDIPLEQHIDKWNGRELWLEAAPETIEITVTRDGSSVRDIPFVLPDSPCHTDTRLCCRYHMAVFDDRAVFTISRTVQDMALLLEKAAALGIQKAVGLYQQLGQKELPQTKSAGVEHSNKEGY